MKSFVAFSSVFVILAISAYAELVEKEIIVEEPHHMVEEERFERERHHDGDFMDR